MIAPEQTYWQIVRTQFFKNRPAVFGMWVVIFLFLLAICAPLISTSSPFVLVKAGESVEFPWFRDLLDQTRWRSGVDLFFNLLLIFLVPTVACVAFFRARMRRVLKIAGVVFLWCFYSVVGPDGLVESGVGKVLFFPQHVFRYSHPKRDYLGVERAGHLQLVLARQRVPKFERQLAEAQQELAELEARFGEPDPGEDFEAHVQLVAVRDRVDAAERQLNKWRGALTEAEQGDGEKRYWAILPPIGYHHEDQDTERVVEGPIWSGWGTGHFLGTDTIGRDVFARLLYGTRISLTIGFIAVAIYCTIGTIIGSIMGFFGGRVDILLMRFVEIMMCFPRLAFILLIVGVTGSRSIFMIMVAIGIVGWAGVARLIRGQFFAERNLDYVAAAEALGIPKRRIVFKHVLPNAIHPMFVSATFGVAAAILVESGLAFLGLGDPNVPSWGQMLLKGRETMAQWLILSPGFAIFLTVTVLNLVGEGLRDALDPKLRQ